MKNQFPKGKRQCGANSMFLTWGMNLELPHCKACTGPRALLSPHTIYQSQTLWSSTPRLTAQELLWYILHHQLPSLEKKVNWREILKWLEGSSASMWDFAWANQMQGYWVEQKLSSARKSSISYPAAKLCDQPSPLKMLTCPPLDWGMNHLKIQEDRFLWSSFGFKPASLQRCLVRHYLLSREAMMWYRVTPQLQTLPQSSEQRPPPFSTPYQSTQFHSFLF